jgi:DNA invertase Pin-like site-specific DNA recombinase
MPLTKRQEKMLSKIVTLVEKFRAEAAKQPAKGNVGGRVRRTAAQAERMRKEILAARAKGVSAAKLAEKYGVSNAYIYMIKE